MTDRRHAIIFNAISRGLSERNRFAALSDREHTARLVGEALDADQPDQTPEPFIITLDLAPNPETIRRIVEGVARASARLNEQTARMRFRAKTTAALVACLDGDDDQAARLLDDCLDAQLYAIEGAASGLALHASRHRKRLAQADETEDVERCPAQTGPVRKAGGEPCGCTLARGHDGDHQCECGAWFVDSVRRDGAEQLGASVTLEAVDEIAGLDRLAPWERDLLTAKAAERRPGFDVIDPETAVAMARSAAGAYDQARADLAAELRNAGTALDAMQHRAETAEHLLEHWADEHIILRVIGGDDVHADWCYRCRIEQAEQRAEAAEATVNAARQLVERWRYQQDRRRAAAEMAPILGVDLSDRTDASDAWRP